MKNLREKLFFSSHFLGVFLNPNYLCRRHIYKNIKSHANLLTGKLLDFGCGEKPYKSLFTNVSDYVGLDYENEGHSHKNEDIVFYDGREIPFPAQHFDSLLSTNVLEHVADLEFSLKEWYRVLKNDGKLLITVPFCFPEHELPHDYRRFTAIGIRQILSENGFTCLKIKKTGAFLEVINQLRISFIEKLFPVKSKVLMLLLRLVIFAPITLWALFWSYILCRQTDKQTLYFDILIFAEKTIQH